MMETWDPAVALLVRGMGYLFLIAAICAVLYCIIKYAVAAGIKLAADDLRKLTEPESSRHE